MPRKHHSGPMLVGAAHSHMASAIAPARRDPIADKKRGVDIDGGNL